MNDNKVEWQMHCDETIKEYKNVILSSPTGSGKTDRYLRWAMSKKERPIFITSPIKSLSNQRFRELREKGYSVGLETGDVVYIPSSEVDFVCCTQEIYNNKYRDISDATLIIDEFAYIFDDQDRCRAYIDSLYYAGAKNIMICSATFGDLNKLQKYINRITNREFYVYSNNRRLTTLEYKGKIDKQNIKNSLVIASSKETCKNIAIELYSDRVKRIIDIVGSKIYNKINHTKEAVAKLAQKYDIDNQELIKLSTIGVAYYYGKLYPKEKLFIEELFENKIIDTIVGTDALAFGVNFPIENVVFIQLDNINKSKFEQISGRAGRKGYYEKGFVYYCNDFKEYINRSLMNKSLDTQFWNLVDSLNSDMKVKLAPNINNLLLGKVTIESEASFIVNYSTVHMDYYEECDKIIEIIEYIKNFNLTNEYVKKYYGNFNFEEGYTTALEKCTPKFKNKFVKLTSDLMHLQSYFNKYIGRVYLKEFSPRKNCYLLFDILTGVTLEKLIENQKGDIRNLLLLKKYLKNLESITGIYYDIQVLDYIIDSLDKTILHPEDVIGSSCVIEKKSSRVSNRNYSRLNLIELITIDSKYYVKLLFNDSGFILCKYDVVGELDVCFAPLDTKYDYIKILNIEEILDILNRINIDTIKEDKEIIINKLQDIENGFKKKMLSNTKKKTKKKKRRY